MRLILIILLENVRSPYKCEKMYDKNVKDDYGDVDVGREVL